MFVFRRAFSWRRLRLASPLLACLVAACSSGGGSDNPDAWYNKTVVENFAGRSSEPPPVRTAAIPAPGMPPAPGQPMVDARGPGQMPMPVADLYRSEGSCGGVVLGTGVPVNPALSSAGPIALEMSECDVVRRAGSPEKVELTPNESGQRLLTLTYSRGEYPRIYRFAAGRLMGIEALPPPPPAPTRAKHAAPRKTTAVAPAVAPATSPWR